MKAFIGIDPGLTGAVAIYYPDTHSLAVFDVPTFVTKRARQKGVSRRKEIDIEELWNQMEFHRPRACLAVIEEVGARPGQGVTSMFTFGKGYGILLGLLVALDIPYKTVRPAVWKGMLGLSPDKAQSRAKATALFEDEAGRFMRAKDDGRAEAALLAWWGAKHFGGGG